MFIGSLPIVIDSLTIAIERHSFVIESLPIDIESHSIVIESRSIVTGS